MTLKVENLLGLGVEEQKEIAEFWDTLDEAIISAHKAGFPIPEKPRFACPQIEPHDLLDISPDQFSIISLQLRSWRVYATCYASQLNGKLKAIQNELDDLRVKTALAIRARAQEAGERKPSEEAIKDAVRNHPRVRELLQLQQRFEQEKELVEPHITDMSRSYQVLSRYIEVRKIEVEMEGRRPEARRRGLT